jgi:hypothetical protein
LTVLDDDGPALSLAAVPNVVPEGVSNGGTLKVSRNTPGGPALPVTLYHTSPDELNIPSQVTIPEGQSFVSVPIATIDDSVSDGDQLVPVSASASGFSGGTSWIIVTDRNIPDLVIHEFQVQPGNLYIGNELPFSVTLKNNGFSTAAYGVTVNVYLSNDNIFSKNDLLLASKPTISAIVPEGFLPISDTLIIPPYLGNYWLFAVVNNDQGINELIYFNNSSEPKPVSILPDYTAYVSVDGDVFNGNNPITISGFATRFNAQPAVNKDVDVYIILNDLRRVEKARTNASGYFSTTFQPINGEAGHYDVGACFPGQGLNTVQDQFTVLGMKHTSGIITWNTVLGEEINGSLPVKNLSSLDLSGVDVSIVSAPPGCDLTFSSGGSISGDATVDIGYHLTATTLSVGNYYLPVKLRILSNEGADYDFDAWFYCTSPVGFLQTTPVSLVSTMVKGQSTLKEYQIKNIGKGNSGLIRTLLPQVPWMKLASPDSILTIPPNGTAVTTIRLTPTDELPLNTPISGTIAINSANANALALPYSFETISNETGDLAVDVMDEYSYYGSSGAHVDSATVILKHPYTGVVITQGMTGQNGIFNATSIPEGYYTLVVQAIRHEGYQNTIFIEKGKVNEKAVFLSFQSISWSWNVVPTEIPDKYEINLIVEFETNVPAPVILMDIPDTMPYLEANQQFPFLITVSNQGLITAHDFELTLPEDDEYEFEAMLNKIDILPQQSVQIPAVMKRRASRQFSFSHNCIEFMFGTYIYICGEDRKKTTADNTRYQFRYCIGESGYEPVPPIVSPSWTFCPTCPPEGPGGPMFTGEGPEPSDLAPTIEIPVLDSLNDCDSCVLKILWWILRCPCTAHYACRAARVVDCVVDVYGECENNWASIGCMTGLKDCDGSPDSQCWLELFDICKSNNKNNGIFLSFLPPIQEKMKIPYREETAKKGYNLELFGDTAWADAPKIEFNYFNDYFNSLSPAGGVTLTPELTDHRPSNISENQVALFVARWNNTMNLLNGLPYDSSNVMDADTLEMYGEIIDSCENASKLLGYPNTSELIYYQLDSLQYYANKKQNSVCAKVSLKFSQNLTMTREAFDGTLTIYNGHETLPIQNVLLDLKIYDETGSIRNDLFQINTISLNELTGIDGSGSLNAMKNGMALIRFIPEKGAAPTLPKSYSFGGTLSYLDPFTGESVNRPLFPVTLTVNPSPDLYLDYFLQRDILGDDALTPESEPSIPAELAVMIQNQGYGIAKNVKLESAQPVITDNEKGLLIEFEIIGSNLGGKPRQLGLYNVNFGNIQPNGIGIGQWWFTSSLLGHFISYDATVNHLDSYGNPDLSLVSSVEIHELIRSVTAYGALYDTISDFLVNDFTDAMDFPDRLYFSNGTDDMVRIATEATVDGPVAVDDTIIHLTVDPSAAGWNYARTEDPGNGQYTICSVTRNDGQVIPLTNVWLTYCTIPDGGEPVYENKLHFLDLFPSGDTAGYNIVFTPVDQGAPRVTRISGIPEGVADLPVDSAVVVFSEPIDSATFTYQDMILRCQGGPNLMDSAVIITKLNDTSYHVNMAGKTNQSGYYTLTVQASGINDLAGNPGTIGKQIAWIQAFDVPAIEMFTGIPDTPGEPVDSVGILFNMPIITSTFTTDKVMLVKNETDTIFPDNILITPADTLHRLFTVSGLSTYNPDDASYRLIINVISIQGENQSWGLLNQSATWIVCQNNPPFAFAGIDDTICAGESFPLSGTVQNQQSFSWTSDGNGYFMNSGTLTPVYLPNETDKITGHVTITLSAFPLNGCSEPVLSSLYLKINKAPFVLAGPDDTIGYGEAFPLIHAIAADYTGLQWSATGSGSFNNPGILHPVYQPSPDDTGHIMLTLTAQGNLPCEPVAASLSLYVRPPDQVVFDVRVLLEGAFTPSTVQMHTRLNELGLIPTMQPYAGEPWNYPGTESFAVLPPNITDWVLVELRDAGTPDSATGSTILPGWPRAMFISSDGTLTDLTGNQPQIDLPSFSKQLFVVIKHRNHIGVMSSSGMLRLGNTLSFDFTTSIQQAFGGGDGYKQIGSNPPRFGMVAGNADGDNNIYISDLNYWMADFGKTMIYSGTDIDLDGNTFISDFNIWAGNFGYISISGTVQPGPRYRSGIPE